MPLCNDPFNELYNDKSFNISNDFSVLSPETKKFSLNVNLSKNIVLVRFRVADFDLNITIYKILVVNLQLKNGRYTLEFLAIGFQPRVLSYVITKRLFLEWSSYLDFYLLFRSFGSFCKDVINTVSRNLYFIFSITLSFRYIETLITSILHVSIL